MYAYWSDTIRTARKQGPNDEVIMYAMTTCGSCKVKEKEFEEYGIRYTEYNVDIDKEHDREMFAKLKEAGYTGAVTTPTFDVNGEMLPNNPSLLEITKHFTAK